VRARDAAAYRPQTPHFLWLWLSLPAILPARPSESSRATLLATRPGACAVTCGPSIAPHTGNSMAPEKVCATPGGDGSSCIPGCYPSGEQCHELGRLYSCSFPPTMLQQALEGQVHAVTLTPRLESTP
jgi:hypothetical protein